jgi:hypothetical protein
MDVRKAHQAALAAEQRLMLPGELTLETLRDYLAAERHRPIVIDELPELSGTDICGMWFAFDDRDVIAHAPTRSPLHCQQVVLHEFSHLILDDNFGILHVESSLTSIPDFELSIIHHVLHRRSFTDPGELAAELLADRLATRIMQGAQRPATEHLAFAEVFG